jgi:hypothetical protein
MAPALTSREAFGQPTPQDDDARIRALEDAVKKLENRTMELEKKSEAAEAKIASLETDAKAKADAAKEPPPYTIGAYAEFYYQVNFNLPSNGITALRGFDNRHDSFTLSNAAVDAQWDAKGVNGRMTLQVGSTPDTYYAAEPSLPGGGGANATSPGLWKFIQQAYVGYRFDVLKGLNVTGGVFLSPIGPESIAVKDNWNWSRSNLFFGLPFYHTGIRITLQASDEIAITLLGSNGWNDVVDNNDGKSIDAMFSYTLKDKLALNLQYFGGPERTKGAPEGQAWRSLFDANAAWTINPIVSVLGHADAGFEPNHFGTSWWAAGALYARVHPWKPLFAAARGDVFYEKVAANGAGMASSIFWPVPWVASATLTLEAQPADNVSFRLEYRHDHAAGDAFFQGNVSGNGSATNPFVANARAQNTLTLGATAWF